MIRPPGVIAERLPEDEEEAECDAEDGDQGQEDADQGGQDAEARQGETHFDRRFGQLFKSLGSFVVCYRPFFVLVFKGIFVPHSFRFTVEVLSVKRLFVSQLIKYI